MSDTASTPDQPAAGTTPTDGSPNAGDGPGANGQPEVVQPDEIQAAEGTSASPAAGQSDAPQEAVTQPAKVMRIGSMVKQLLEEVRNASLDEASRERLAEVYERSIVELSEALSDDLQEELRSLALPFDHDEVPSEAELRVAKAQLVGWLEGLFHGIQASLMAQQAVAQQQLAQMRQLPNGQIVPAGQMPGQPQAAPAAPGDERPGTYL